MTNRNSKWAKPQWMYVIPMKMSLPADHADKPYQFDKCPKRFHSKYNLKQHKLIHSGVKPYECRVCHKKFRYPSDLQMHERIHSDEKPYTCGTCHKEFTHVIKKIRQSSDLQSPERIHTS